MENNTTSSAYTKGEWHIDRQSPHSPICIKPYPGSIVCDIEGTDAEAEANARLIAAAPVLLEACQYIVSLTECGHWGREALIMMKRTGVPVLKEAIGIATEGWEWLQHKGENAPHSEE
jgi:hypothetical protein